VGKAYILLAVLKISPALAIQRRENDDMGSWVHSGF
jgi:hypothetical protein